MHRPPSATILSLGAALAVFVGTLGLGLWIRTATYECGTPLPPGAVPACGAAQNDLAHIWLYLLVALGAAVVTYAVARRALRRTSSR